MTLLMSTSKILQGGLHNKQDLTELLSQSTLVKALK